MVKKVPQYIRDKMVRMILTEQQSTRLHKEVYEWIENQGVDTSTENVDFDGYVNAPLIDMGLSSDMSKDETIERISAVVTSLELILCDQEEVN